MLVTILHTVPYAVGVCVCGGLAAHAALKGLGRLNGYHIGLSIEPVDMNVEEALNPENRIPRRRSGDDRRAARALAEARSRERTRSYLREAKELDSEARRQFEAARAKQDAAWRVKNTQDASRDADAQMLEAVRIAAARRKYQEARVAELDAIRAERKAAKAAAAEQRERKEQAAEEAEQQERKEQAGVRADPAAREPPPSRSPEPRKETVKPPSAAAPKDNAAVRRRKAARRKGARHG